MVHGGGEVYADGVPVIAVQIVGATDMPLKLGCQKLNIFAFSFVKRVNGARPIQKKGLHPQI
jgi:hypothetical protein